jgi:phage-related protein
MTSVGQAVGAFVADAIPKLVAFGQVAIPAVLAGVQALAGVLVPVAERVQTFFASLASGGTLAQTVNAAFGDLIPAGLGPMLDLVDAGFQRVRDAVVGVVGVLQVGGLAGAWAAVQAAMSDFGPTGERIQAALSAVGQAIAALVPQPLRDFVGGLLGAAQGASDGAQPLSTLATVVNAVSAALEAGVRWLNEHRGVLAVVAGGVTGLATAYTAMRVVQLAAATATAAVTLATNAQTVAMGALNLVMRANPIGLVVTLLGALAGALVYAYENSEEFRNVVDGAFAVLKSAATTAITAASGLLTGLAELVKAVGQTVTGWASTVASAFGATRQAVAAAMSAISRVVSDGWNAMSTAVGAALGLIRAGVETGWGAVQGVTEAVTGAISGLVSDGWLTIKAGVLTPLADMLPVAQAAWDSLKTAVDEATGGALSAVIAFGAGLLKTLGDLVGETIARARALGQSIIDGLKEAIRGGAQGVIDAIGGVVRDAIDAAKRALGARSPSQEFVRVGLWITEGLAVGVQRGAAAVLSTMRRFMTSIIDAVTGEQVTRWPSVGAALVARVAEGIADTTPDVVRAITALGDRAGVALRDLTAAIGGKWSGWIGEVIAKRTELLHRFNYEAWKRGEGTKVLEPLEDATRDFLTKTEVAVREASERLVKLATGYQAAVLAARAEAARQVQSVVADAAAKIAELAEARSLQRRIEQQKDAFARMQQIQKEAFDRQQAQLEGALRLQEDAARIAFQAQLRLGRIGVDAAPGVTAAQQALDAQTELLRIGFQADRDMARATTDAARAEIAQRAQDAKQALQDRLDEERLLVEATRDLRLRLQQEQIEAERQQALRALQDRQAEALYVEQETAALRTEILARQVAMEQIVERQRRDFEERLEQESFDRAVARIGEERDARITAINEALKAKEDALRESYEKERLTVIDALQKQLKDYQELYIDKVKAAFQQAGVDIVDFLDTINNDLKRRTAETSAQIIAMAEELARIDHAIGGTPRYGYAPAPTLPNTAPSSPASPVVLPMSPPAVNVTVNALNADIDSAGLARELWRQGVLTGG